VNFDKEQYQGIEISYDVRTSKSEESSAVIDLELIIGFKNGIFGSESLMENH